MPNPGGQGTLGGVAFSPTNSSVLAIGEINGVEVWNLATRAARTFPDPDSSRVEDVAYTSDGKDIVEGNQDGNIFYLDATSGRKLPESFTETAVSSSQGIGLTFLQQVAVSPTGSTVAAADSAGNVYVWNVSGGAPLVVKGAVTGTSVQIVAFSPDGKTLAIASDTNVRLLNVATRAFSAPLAGPGTSPMAVMFSPDGATLAVADLDNDIYLWSLATRHEAAISTLVDSLDGLAFSPDGKTIAAFGSLTPEVDLYSIKYGPS